MEFPVSQNALENNRELHPLHGSTEQPSGETICFHVQAQASSQLAMVSVPGRSRNIEHYFTVAKLLVPAKNLTSKCLHMKEIVRASVMNANNVSLPIEEVEQHLTSHQAGIILKPSTHYPVG